MLLGCFLAISMLFWIQVRGLLGLLLSHQEWKNLEIALIILRGRPKGAKNRVKHKGLSPGSASSGAGAILKRLRNSKVDGKGRSRSESSPLVRNGKRRKSSKSPVDEVVAKVLDRIRVSKQMVFGEGIIDCDLPGKNSVIKDKSFCSVGMNDGSFINKPIEPVVTDMEVNRESIEDKVGGVGDCVDPLSGNNNASKLTMADGEHGKVESVRKSDKDGKVVAGGDSTFVFGDIKRNKGILNKPPVGFTKVQFGPSLFYKSSNVWSSSKAGVNAVNIESFAEKMKKGVEERELQMKFVPQSVSTQSDGTKRISISVDIKKGSEACALQLYGYFVGTSMDYRVVYANLIKMWRAYGIADITKTSAGLFYFKFKNEEGMKAVLDSGTWMVNNVPLVLNVWEPGIWLEKVEPSTLPIWVCVYGIPMELCNGNGIGKIMSGIGKPMLMDKLTKERCLKKAGKLDFARVLVEVSASDELLLSLEIEYPAMGDRPGRVGKLEVKYQWKSPQCSHCKTFGHSTVACKVRPRTKDEIAAKVLKDALNVSNEKADVSGAGNIDNEGFVTVGKNNKPVGVANHVNRSYSGNGAQSRGVLYGNRSFSGYNSHKVGNRGPNQQNRSVNSGGSKNQSNFVKPKVSGGNANGGLKSNVKSVNGGPNINIGVDKKSIDKTEMVSKPPLMSKYNAHYQPKVRVRGSNSKMPANVSSENVPVSNSYQVLEDQDMLDKEESFLNSVDEEFLSSVWPKLKSEVDVVLQSGVYPDQSVRVNWSLHQLNYFYNNCSKFGMEICEDDDEVESVKDGMAMEMKPDGCDNVPVVVNNGTNENDVVINGEWVWPSSLLSKFEFLTYLPPPLLFHDRNDVALWKSGCGKVCPFSVKTAFTDLSHPKPVVPWFKIIWFSQNIPKFAFILWLAINKKLNTQDKVAVWNNVDELNCSLCHSVMDNHDHLFFGCDYSTKVWCHFKGLMRFDEAPDNLESVRLRLLSLKIKGSKNSLDASKIWGFQFSLWKVGIANWNISRTLIGSGKRDLLLSFSISSSFVVVFPPFSVGFSSWTVQTSPVWCKPSLDDTWSSLFIEYSWCTVYPTWCVPSTDDVWILWLCYDPLVSNADWFKVGYLMICCLMTILLLDWCGSIYRGYCHGSLDCICHKIDFSGHGCCIMTMRNGSSMMVLVLVVKDRMEWSTIFLVIVDVMGCLEGYFAHWNAFSVHLIGLYCSTGSYVIELVILLVGIENIQMVLVFGHQWNQIFLFNPGKVLKANYILVGVTSESCSLFPYPGFVPMGFSQEGFLRRQSHLAKCSIVLIRVFVLKLKMKILSLAFKLKFMVICLDWCFIPFGLFWFIDFSSCIWTCNKDSYRRALLYLVMFPKHVLGMSFRVRLYGFVHIRYL
ncbi:hypothetical protein CTI12_AA393700 [Artemisia annua]|uniref:Reverse transcriptase zinc-binding domain-containing protein n=1 Tax=Artemisia annua TaxID=35608 RepID=A0A2U1L6P7_ARTAN|nr:hypothetical protein CTI12_AA393700 [Artemisia annua]